MPVPVGPKIAHNLSKTVRVVASPGDVPTPRTAFGEAIFNRGGIYRSHRQRYFQLYGVIDGCIDIERRDYKVHIEAGQVALLTPGVSEFQQSSTGQKTRHIWCSIHPSMLTDAMAQACTAATRVLPLTHRMEQFIKCGLSLPQGCTPCAQVLLETVGMAALWEYLFADEQERSQEPKSPDTLRRALEWIDRKGIEPTNLEGLAREVGISPGRLNKLFRRHLDTTPMHYLWKTRTRAGAQLLRETSLPISEIAYASGFQTVHHFARLVRQHFGISPRQFRAQARTENLP